jgi:hypothetical protein
VAFCFGGSMMKLPIVVENSKVPGFLSKFANANYVAVSFAIFIFFKYQKDEQVWRHEMIHYRQQQELFFVGQWVMYAIYYLMGLYKYRDRYKAYRENPFEREAYSNQEDPIYLIKRKKYSWKDYRG